MKLFRNVILALLSILIITWIFKLIGCNETSNQTQADIKQKARENVQARIENEEKNAIYQQMTDLLDVKSGIMNFNVDGYAGSLESINAAQSKIIVYSERIKKAQQSQDADILTLSKELEPLLTSLKKDAYPKLRRFYTDAVAKKLWRDNIYVKSNGTTISFTGYQFYSNANVEDFYLTVLKSLKLLKFKEIRFYKSKDSEEYIYYKIDSNADIK